MFRMNGRFRKPDSRNLEPIAIFSKSFEALSFTSLIDGNY
jgi:hypothetical protein